MAINYDQCTPIARWNEPKFRLMGNSPRIRCRATYSLCRGQHDSIFTTVVGDAISILWRQMRVAEAAIMPKRRSAARATDAGDGGSEQAGRDRVGRFGRTGDGAAPTSGGYCRRSQ
jgi:hypothetical protein